MKRYAVYGQGRVGSALVRSLRAAGLSVAAKRGHALARGVADGFDVVFLAVPEAALLQYGLNGSFVIVSGSVDPKSLPFSAKTFHPLMGFSEKGPKTFRDLPVGVDDKALFLLAKYIGAKPFWLPKNRTLYHAAAVLAGAGVLTAFRDACAIVGVDHARDVLLPIAHAALDRDMLTGPVVRGDEKTIAAHRKALRPNVRRTYDALLKSMRDKA